MEFTFAQVGDALASTNDIADSKRGAFNARLQHLQKLGFPQGINTGRGRAAKYSVGHVYQIGFALELCQLGLTPERATRQITDRIYVVAMAAALAAKNGAPDGDFKNPVLVFCDPAVLRTAMAVESEEAPHSPQFFFGELDEATRYFGRFFRGGLPRMAFFSVSNLFWRLASSLSSTSNVAELYGALGQWADEYVYDEEKAGADVEHP